MLKLKLQYFGHLMWRVDSLEKTLMLVSLVAQRLKHLPPMRETWVWSLGWEDPLGKEMAIHSSILASRIPWTEKPSRSQSTGSQRVRHDWVTSPKLTWCWEGLGAGGKEDDRGWDGWMGSPTRWSWVWVNSGSWWWTGRAGVLQFMGSQRVGDDWVTELNWIEFNSIII